MRQERACLFRNIAKCQVIAGRIQKLTVANKVAGNGRDPRREVRKDHNEATIYTDLFSFFARSATFPMPKTIGEAFGTSRNKKILRIKIASEADSYDPHVLTRGSRKKGVSKNSMVPVAVQRYCNQLVRRSASPGSRRAFAK